MKPMEHAARLTLLSALLLAACNSDGPNGMPPNLDGGSSMAFCSVDDQNRPEKAVPIQVGQRYQDDSYVCPPTDFDWYSITLPAGSPLITVDLSYDMGVTSAVELAYDLYTAADTEVPIAGGRDDMPQDNRSSVVRTHYLDSAGGAYFIKVRDVGDDDQDIRNSYALTVTAGTDPDTNEPNDDCANATPLAGSASGVLAADTDKDAYSFDVPAGIQIVDVHVTTTEASPIDFRATLYAPGASTFASRAEDRFGEDGPTDVHLRHGLDSAGGTYCVVVEDDDGVESSPDVTYTITLQVIADTDPTEQAGRNDTPSTAVNLGSGGSQTGIIGSIADLDWFKVDAQIGQIISVDLQCPGCEIQPAVVYVYSHPDSPCTEADQCDFLLQPSDCQLDTDCGSGVCRDTPAGRRCGESCDDPLDCPSFQCQQTGSVSACTAVGFCTGEGSCGVQQFARTGEMGSVRTAQPALSTITYILVHDFEDNDFSSVSYTLNISVRDDPDPNEPNNFYVPTSAYDIPELEFDSIPRRSRMDATPVNWVPSGGRAVVTGSGCISYEGDIDVFRLVGGNPCVVATSSTGAGGGDCGMSLTYDRPLNSPLDLAYFLLNNNGGTRASFLASQEGSELVFGDGACGTDTECMVYFGNDNDDYYLVVRHFGQDEWSLDPSYCYTFSITSATGFGCPASCPDNNNPSGLCNCP